VVGDYVSYLQLSERDKALSIILGIFEEIFQKARKKKPTESYNRISIFRKCFSSQEQFLK
jgi:hypothetical protein